MCALCSTRVLQLVCLWFFWGLSFHWQRKLKLRNCITFSFFFKVGILFHLFEAIPWKFQGQGLFSPHDRCFLSCCAASVPFKQETVSSAGWENETWRSSSFSYTQTDTLSNAAVALQIALNAMIFYFFISPNKMKPIIQNKLHTTSWPFFPSISNIHYCAISVLRLSLKTDISFMFLSTINANPFLPPLKLLLKTI